MMRNCASRISQMSNGYFSEKEAEKLLKEIEESAKARRKSGQDMDQAIREEAALRAVKAKEESVLQRRNALINTVKDVELNTKMDDLIASGLSPRKALQAILVGVQGNVKEGRLSVDAKQKQLVGKYMGGMVRDLEAEGLLPLVSNRALEKEIAAELWELSIDGGRIGVSKSREAQKIAKILNKYMEATRLRQNRAGAAIGKVEGFIGSQSHDMGTIRKAGFNEWFRAIRPLLDEDRTFQGANPEEFLKGAYDGLASGIHLKAHGADDGKLFEFKGASNLAKKISQERKLHFKSADAFLQYNQAFGKRDFIDGVIGGIERGTRNIALMETFGTNPRAMFDRLLSKTQEKYRADPKKLKGIEGNARGLRNFYDEVEGATNMVDIPTLASVGSTVRGLQSLSKLGGVILSSVADIPLKAAELQFQGFGIAESYGISFKDIFKGVGSSERKQLASTIGVGFEGMTGAIASRFSAHDDVPGAMAKTMRLFFKLNGLTWWTDANKIGTGLAMSHRLAQFKGKSFDKLNPDTKRIFGTYGITAEDWDIIRKSATKQLNGEEYITADSIHDLPDDAFNGIKNIQKAKEQIEQKLQAYFIDRVDHATITPDAREVAVAKQGTKRGTIEGEALRTIMQFKNFPISMLTKVYGRALYGKGKADIPAMVQTTIMTTLFGYIAMSMKDLAKGREPRDPSEPNTWKAALLQGGGLGILGDFMFGEFNRMGQNLTTSLLGPTASTVNDLASLYAAARGGDDPSAKALNTLINNAPFMNLVYLRPALNYMFIYQMQEALNPGYLRRMERRVQKENNQKFIIKPSSVAR